jgi:hypothetical protein
MRPSDPAVTRGVANGLSESSAVLGSGSVRRYPNDCRESFAPLRFGARCRGFPDTPPTIPDTRSRRPLTAGSPTRADHSVR